MVQLGSPNSATEMALAGHRDARPDAIALRFKSHGRWRAWTWRALDQEVAALARGLATLGFRPGQRLWLVGAPSPRQLTLWLAAERAGGTALAVDPDDAPGAFREEPAPEIVFAEDRDAVAFLDALLSRRPGTATRLIVVDDTRGRRARGDQRLMTYESLRATAHAAAVDHGPASSVASSGSSSMPTGHADLAATDRALLLPLAWKDGARGVVQAWAGVGFALGFPEHDGNREADIRELGPTVLFGRASTYGEVVDRARERLPGPGTWRRRLLDPGVAGGPRAGAIVRLLLLSPLRRALGLRDARLVIVVGDALPADTRAFLAGLDLRTLVLAAPGDTAETADATGGDAPVRCDADARVRGAACEAA